MITDQMVEAAIKAWNATADDASTAEAMRAALTAAIGDAVVVPAGWQLVPVKPTREMTMHACTALPAVDGVFGHAGALSAMVYTRMLEVAPTLAVPRHDRGGAAE